MWFGEYLLKYGDIYEDMHDANVLSLMASTESVRETCIYEFDKYSLNCK